jgi:hypothetical protein
MGSCIARIGTNNINLGYSPYTEHPVGTPDLGSSWRKLKGKVKRLAPESEQKKLRGMVLF